jgi:hypothetical protein
MIVGQRQVDHRLVPGGVILASRAAAPPVSASVGAPEGR